MSKQPSTIIISLILTFFSFNSSSAIIDDYFENRLNHLSNLLVQNKDSLKKNNIELSQFVNANVLPLWSSETTLKALLGSKTWKKIALPKQKELINAFNLTLHRYVREGMKFYDDQKFSFVSTNIGKKGNRGYLTIKIEPDLLPAIDVTFKMTKINDGWKLYDILLVGVSYVKMKKLEVRRLYAEHGVDSVLKLLREKNSNSKISSKNDKGI